MSVFFFSLHRPLQCTPVFLLLLLLQDTIVAMEALMEFAQVDTHRNVFDMVLSVESTANPSWKAYSYLSKHNYTTLQTHSVSGKKSRNLICFFSLRRRNAIRPYDNQSTPNIPFRYIYVFLLRALPGFLSPLCWPAWYK